MTGGMRAFVRCLKVGEVEEGVLWVVMIRVDKRLNMVIGLGGG